MGYFYIKHISRCSLELIDNAQGVTARDKLYFLYKSDSSRSCSVEISRIDCQRRGALNRLGTQIMKPLSSEVVVQDQNDSKNS